MTFELNPVIRESAIQINADVSYVFPLFEPLNEKLWVDNRDSQVVYPPGGEAVEDMVFITKPRFDGESDDKWILTRLDRREHRVHYTFTTSARIWFVKVYCIAEASTTKATIRYQYIGLTVEGQSRNLQVIQQIFKDDLRDWERALNNYARSSGWDEAV